ncbi:hypothetical protein BDZ88DRAFT_481776 [Geranomyces variabilis]|nr:hypothetical protein BDZ88DRAFT_481776 [Geranomyces variabilis]
MGHTNYGQVSETAFRREGRRKTLLGLCSVTNRKRQKGSNAVHYFSVCQDPKDAPDGLLLIHASFVDLSACSNRRVSGILTNAEGLMGFDGAEELQLCPDNDRHYDPEWKARSFGGHSVDLNNTFGFSAYGVIELWQRKHGDEEVVNDWVIKVSQVRSEKPVAEVLLYRPKIVPSKSGRGRSICPGPRPPLATKKCCGPSICPKSAVLVRCTFCRAKGSGRGARMGQTGVVPALVPAVGAIGNWFSGPGVAQLPANENQGRRN